MFICAGNTFLTSKVHSFRKMGLSANIEWTSISSLVQIFEVVNWPYITKVFKSVKNHINADISHTIRNRNENIIRNVP